MGQIKNKNKRIGFFMEQYGLGGTDVQLVNLINNWPAASDDIYYITNRDNKGLMLFNSLLKRECKVIMIGFTSFAYFSQKISRLILPKPIVSVLSKLLLLAKYPLFLIDILKLNLVLRKYSFDVFISDNGGYPGSDSCRAAIFSAALCGIPRLYALIHHEAQPIEKIFGPIEPLIDKYLQRSVRAVITVSQASANSLLARGFSAAKIKIIYNGLEDVSPLKDAQDLKSKYGICAGRKLVGLMGNVEPHKGHQVLIEAAPMVIDKLPDTHFIFIGSFHDENWQRTQADKILDLIKTKKLADHITMTGYLEGHPLDFIEQFDLLVVPTLDFEGFGLVLAEAMILRKPIVASRVGAIPEVIVDGESGLLVPPGEPAALAAAIIELLSDSNKAQRLANNARNRYENNFTARKMAEGYYQVVNG